MAKNIKIIKNRPFVAKNFTKSYFKPNVKPLNYGKELTDLEEFQEKILVNQNKILENQEKIFENQQKNFKNLDFRLQFIEGSVALCFTATVLVLFLK